MNGHPADVLEQARRDAGLSLGQLWMRYFALGGMASAAELEAMLHGALVPSPADDAKIVHALNERLIEIGGKERIA